MPRRRAGQCSPALGAGFCDQTMCGRGGGHDDRSHLCRCRDRGPAGNERENPPKHRARGQKHRVHRQKNSAHGQRNGVHRQKRSAHGQRNGAREQKHSTDSRNTPWHSRNTASHRRNAPSHRRNTPAHRRNTRAHRRNTASHRRNAPAHRRISWSIGRDGGCAFQLVSGVGVSYGNDPLTRVTPGATYAFLQRFRIGVTSGVALRSASSPWPDRGDRRSCSFPCRGLRWRSSRQM